MHTGFGALGEWYTADKCKAKMLAKGIGAGIINGSGDMDTWGKQISGKPFSIGISNPFHYGGLYAVCRLKKGAVTTSGGYD